MQSKGKFDIRLQRNGATLKKDYSYQKPLINNVYKHLKNKENVVLAACPGAGKTNMAIEIMDRFLKENPKGKVVVLSHCQTILRSQWLEFLEKSNTEHSFNSLIGGAQVDASYDSASISITLPTSLMNAKNGIKKADLLIIDEAHHYYLQTMVQKIIKEMRPKSQLLLTGTPSIYVGKKEFNMTGISVEELLKYGTITDPFIELVESAYEYKYADYLESDDLPASKLGRRRTIQTMDKILPQIITKLQNNYKEDPENTKWANNVNSWEYLTKKLKKTMIVCQTVLQAEVVRDYLESKNINCIISVSEDSKHHHNQTAQKGSDWAIKSIHKFKEDENYNVLIVVKRGVLGFNYEDLMNVIDLTGSLNANRIFQLLCRVLRVSELNPKEKKIFIKVTTKEMAFVNYFVMSFVVALGLKEYYYSYKTNYRTHNAVPVNPEFIRLIKTIIVGDKKQVLPDLPKVLTFKDLVSVDGDIKPLAYTSFNEVLKRAYLKQINWSEELIHEMCGKCKTRTEFHKTYPMAGSYIDRTKKGWILDERYGEKFRWSEEKILKLPRYASISQFRENNMGAWNWVKKHKKQNWLRETFGFKYHAKNAINGWNAVRSNPNTKLNKKIADEIRLEIKNGTKQKDLMKKYGVSKSTISYISNNKIWNSELREMAMPNEVNYKKSLSQRRYRERNREKINLSKKEYRKDQKSNIVLRKKCASCGRRNWHNPGNNICNFCDIRSAQR